MSEMEKEKLMTFFDDEMRKYPFLKLQIAKLLTRSPYLTAFMTTLFSPQQLFRKLGPFGQDKDNDQLIVRDIIQNLS